MGVPLKTNRYAFPFGYRIGVPQPSSYVPWNGYLNGYNSPQADILGPVLQFVTSAAPADLSTMTVTGYDGKVYLFQFVYNASVQTLGIKIPLPASGASTAAQVMTAIVGVLSQGSGVTIGGQTVYFPWNFQTINATTSRLNWNVPGVPGATASPAGVAITVIASFNTPTLTARTAVAKAGFIGAFLPGA
jgi:hypothetical protein